MTAHATASPATPTIAKAKLVTQSMRAASRARLDARAHAVLAIVLAESWWSPDDQAWAAHLSRSTLKTRLSCSRASIQRAVADLGRARLVHYRPGDGAQGSSFVLDHNEQGGGLTGETPPVSPVSRGDLTGGREAPTGETPPVSRVSALKTQSVNQPAPPTPEAGPGGAAAGEPRALTDAEIALAKVLFERPPWLHPDTAWIDADCCAELVRSPAVTIDAIHAAIKDAKNKRKDFANPAGHVIKLLRRAATQLVYRTAFHQDEERRRAAAAQEFPQ